MAQREIEPLVIADLLDAVKKDAVEAATAPESDRGTDISPLEWERIQRADLALKRLYRYAEGLQFFVSGIRLGIDAPSVQRNGRDLFRHDDHEPHAERMRR